MMSAFWLVNLNVFFVPFSFFVCFCFCSFVRPVFFLHKETVSLIIPPAFDCISFWVAVWWNVWLSKLKHMRSSFSHYISKIPFKCWSQYSNQIWRVFIQLVMEKVKRVNSSHLKSDLPKNVTLYFPLPTNQNCNFSFSWLNISLCLCHIKYVCVCV